MGPTRKERTYIKPEDYKETPGIVYRPWVKYGSNSGYDYLSEKDDAHVVEQRLQQRINGYPQAY